MQSQQSNRKNENENMPVCTIKSARKLYSKNKQCQISTHPPPQLCNKLSLRTSIAKPIQSPSSPPTPPSIHHSLPLRVLTTAYTNSLFNSTPHFQTTSPSARKARERQFPLRHRSQRKNHLIPPFPPIPLSTGLS